MEPSGPFPPELAAELEELSRQRDAGAISEITYNVRRNLLLNRWEVSKRRAARDTGGLPSESELYQGLRASGAGSAETQGARDLPPSAHSLPAGSALPGSVPAPDTRPSQGWAPQPWNPAPVPGVAYGGFWIRAFAALIDSIIVYVPLAVVFFVLIRYSIQTRSLSGINDVIIGWLIAYVAIAVGYGIVFIAIMGATPGMRMLSLRVVRAADGGSCGWARAIVRGISWTVFGFLSRFLVGLLDPLWAAWDSRSQTLHDKLAGTVVIRHWKQSEGLLSPDGHYRWDGSSWQPVSRGS